MSLSYDLFDAIRSFDNIRRNNREEYLSLMKRIERNAGSEGYKQDSATAKQKREQADNAARKNCADKVNAIIKQMRENIGKYPLAPPTQEQIAILQVLSMKTRFNKQEFDRAAQSMNGNSLALSALNELADRLSGNTDNTLEQHHPNYMVYATDLSGDATENMLRSVASSCKSILQSPVKSAALLSAKHGQQVYNRSYDPDDLPQREPLVSERGFFADCIPDSQLDNFLKVVNGNND